MKERPLITRQIAAALEHHLNPKMDPRVYTASEVTFNYATKDAVRVDYMEFKPQQMSPGGIEQGIFYCYEIKSCMSDYNSGHGLNDIGDYNYIVTTTETAEILKKRLEWTKWGLYAMDKNGGLKCVRRATKTIRKYPALEMLMMMFRSSNRELIKYKKAAPKHVDIMSGADLISPEELRNRKDDTGYDDVIIETF